MQFCWWGKTMERTKKKPWKEHLWHFHASSRRGTETDMMKPKPFGWWIRQLKRDQAPRSCAAGRGDRDPCGLRSRRRHSTGPGSGPAMAATGLTADRGISFTPLSSPPSLREAAARPQLERCFTPNFTTEGRRLCVESTAVETRARLREARAGEPPGSGHLPAAGERESGQPLRLCRRSQLLSRAR